MSYSQESHLRQLIFLRKRDCLGCAVLFCLVVCLILLAYFLPSFSHLSLKHVCSIAALKPCDIGVILKNVFDVNLDFVTATVSI